MNPLISVIIPVYNAEMFLRQCLDSVVRQTYKLLDIIIIDDGSSDESGIICDEFAQKDSRITVLHKANEGVQKARNDGILMARGDWITFVDSDDWCEINYYERMIQELGEREADVFVSGGMYLEYIKKRGKKINYPSTFDYYEKREIELLEAKVLCGKIGDEGNKYAATLGSQCDKLYRKSFLMENDILFNEELNVLEDVFFNLCALKQAKRVIGGQYIGYHYRQVTSSTSHMFCPQRENYLLSFLEKVYLEIKSQENNVIFKEAYRYRCLISLFDILKLCYLNVENPTSYWKKVGGVKRLKKKPVFKDAIQGCNFHYLSHKQRILLMFLRFPCVLPIAMAFLWKEWKEYKMKGCYSISGGYNSGLSLVEFRHVNYVLWEAA